MCRAPSQWPGVLQRSEKWSWAVKWAMLCALRTGPAAQPRSSTSQVRLQALRCLKLGSLLARFESRCFESPSACAGFNSPVLQSVASRAHVYSMQHCLPGHSSGMHCSKAMTACNASPLLLLSQMARCCRSALRTPTSASIRWELQEIARAVCVFAASVSVFCAG